MIFKLIPLFSIHTLVFGFLLQTEQTGLKPLYTTRDPIPNSYIVVLNNTISQKDYEAHIDGLSFAVLNSGQTSNKIIHKHDMPHLKAYSGTFDQHVLNSIRLKPEVAFVEHDSVMKINQVDTEDFAPWGLARVSHRKPLGFGTYNKYDYDDNAGECTVAYVIDTGVNIKHVDFEGRATWGATIPTGDEDIDGNGHGSHCAGTVAGKKYGVAKKAKIIAVKVLRSNGSGSTSDVIKGIEWAAKDSQKIARKAKKSGECHKGSVANMSLGGGYSRAMNMVVNSAVDMGLNMAVAAGNDNRNACDYSPASAEKAVSVGATSIVDERAWFSNYGECVDVFAPGKDITSVWNSNPHAINTISGTSMASPHICGLLSYLLSQAPEKNSSSTSFMSPKELKQQLLEYATRGAVEDAGDKSPNLLAYNGVNNK